MATIKPTIVIAHGIWHSPPTYEKLITALQREGYEVYAPFLPSCTGASPPTISLPEDTQLFRRLIEILVDQGKTVIITMHSYGGAVACNAIEGLDINSRKEGGVAHLIGISAHVHPTDFSILDLVHEMCDDELIPLAFDIADDGTCASANAKAALFNGIPDDEAESLCKTLSRANYQNLKDKMQFDGWKYIPLTYIVTTEDMTMPAHYQKHMLEKIEKAGCKVEVVEIQSGHSPYVNKTAEVVRVVNDVVRKIT